MNVKEGDRAEIIWTPGGKSVGTIVRVGWPEGIHSQWGPLWNVHGECEAIETTLGHGADALCADAWLRKVQDPPKTKAVPRVTEDVLKK